MRRNRKTKTQTVPLPWEHQGRWILGLISGNGPKLVVAAAFLTWVFIGFYQKIDHQEKSRITRQSTQQIRRSVLLFRKEIGRCPKSNQELVHPPKSSARYLKKVPLDGWGRPFLIQCPGYSAEQDVDVISAGPSGSFFVDDNL